MIPHSNNGKDALADTSASPAARFNDGIDTPLPRAAWLCCEALFGGGGENGPIAMSTNAPSNQYLRFSDSQTQILPGEEDGAAQILHIVQKKHAGPNFGTPNEMKARHPPRVRG